MRCKCLSVKFVLLYMNDCIRRHFHALFHANSPLETQVGPRSAGNCQRVRLCIAEVVAFIFCFFKHSLCDRKVLIVVGFPILKVSQPETSFPRVGAERVEEDESTVSEELGPWIELVRTDPFLSERPD
jgi:hypothetical protein